MTRCLFANRAHCTSTVVLKRRAEKGGVVGAENAGSFSTPHLRTSLFQGLEI